MSTTAAIDPKSRAGKNYDRRAMRLFVGVGAVNAVGRDAAVLFAVLLNMEDQFFYKPVNLFNGQLMTLCGFTSEDMLARARRPLVERGWLVYKSGGNGVAGLYTTTVPAEYREQFDYSGPTVFSPPVFPAESSAGCPAESPAPVRGMKTNPRTGAGDSAGRSAEPLALFPIPQEECSTATPSPARKSGEGKKTPAKGKKADTLSPEQSAAYKAAVAVWRELWGAKYGRSCSFNGADGKVVKWMLSELGQDVSKFRATVEHYLSDRTPYFSQREHPLILLNGSGEFNKHKPADRPAAQRAPPTPSARGACYDHTFIKPPTADHHA